MGIDPGTNIMGFGVIRVTGRAMSFVAMDELDLRRWAIRFSTQTHLRGHHASDRHVPSGRDRPRSAFLREKRPVDAQTGARPGGGDVGGAGAQIPITEYLPKKVKMAITGNGNASKEQVAGMLAQLLRYKDLPKHLDSTDALGIAVCHFFNSSGRERPRRVIPVGRLSCGKIPTGCGKESARREREERQEGKTRYRFLRDSSAGVFAWNALFFYIYCVHTIKR